MGNKSGKLTRKPSDGCQEPPRDPTREQRRLVTIRAENDVEQRQGVMNRLRYVLALVLLVIICYVIRPRMKFRRHK